VAVQLEAIACVTCHHKDCDGSQGFKPFSFEGEALKGCPLPMITQESATLIGQWPHYDKGYLPGAGGILDQTAIYVEGMTIINSEIMKHREEKAEEERKKHG
jgi:hypothetical protein